MEAKISKTTTILVMLAFFASIFTMVPTGADSRAMDVYVIEHQIDAANKTPLMGTTIQIGLHIQCDGDEDCTGVSVKGNATTPGEAVIDLGTQNPADITTGTSAWFNFTWDSTAKVPMVDKAYELAFNVSCSADTNVTNGTYMPAAATITWKAPDLIVTAIAVPNDVLIGDMLDVTITVKNNGSAAFTGNETLDYGITGGTMLTDAYVSGETTALAPAATVDVDVSIDTTGKTAGDYNISAQIMDMAAAFISEDISFIPKVPDLAVVSLIADPTTVKATEEMNFTATFENTGTADATDATVKFFDFDTEIDTMTVDVPMGWDNVTATTTWTAGPEGSHNITVKILIGTVEQANKTISVSIGPAPHTVLAVSGIAFSMTPAALDEPGDEQDFNITVTVANSGDFDAIGATVTLEVMAGVNGTKVAVGTKTVDVLMNGGTAVAEFTYTAETMEEAVTLTFYAKVEKGTDMAEINKSVDVPGDIDAAEIVVNTLTSNVATQQQKKVIIFTIEVENVGDADATAVEILLKKDNTTVTTFTEDINTTNATATLVFEWTIPATEAVGDKLFEAVVGDSIVNLTVAVTEYLLPVVKFEFDTSMDYTGKGDKTYEIAVNVSNTGNAAATGIYVTVTDSETATELYNTTINAPIGDSNFTFSLAVKAGTTYNLKLVYEYTWDGTDYSGEAINQAVAKADKKKKESPGFELVVVIGAVLVAVFAIGRKRL
jgi:hypothetical protein